MKSRLIRFTYYLGLLFALATAAQAQTNAFSYQGQLLNSGAPANGSHEFEISLYPAASGGTQLEILTLEEIEVTNGLFTVLLDFKPSHFTGAALWLEIRVRPSNGPSFATLSPRQPISPNAYALHAYQAGIATLASNVPAGSITSTQLAAGAVGMAQLASNSITAAQLAPGAVGAAQLSPGAAAANLAAGGYSLLPSGAIVMAEPRRALELTQAGLVPMPGQFTVPQLWEDLPPGPPATGALSSGRFAHGAAWNGTYLFVYGGDPVTDGLRYDAGSNVWSFSNPTNAPVVGNCHVFWTGTYFLVWDSERGIGGRYNPVNNTWLSVSTVNAPSSRFGASAVWAGSRMIVWGGTYGQALNTGARYDPATDTWSPVSAISNPSARYFHSAVWTGTEMIIHGGQQDISTPSLTSGRRYNPNSDTWLPMAASQSKRAQHTAVWTGTQMIVFGGASGVSIPPVGERYTLSTDTWSTIAPNSNYGGSAGLNSRLLSHTAVWTGSRMIAVGGQVVVPSQFGMPGQTTVLNKGGSYDPALNTWTDLPLMNSPRAGHSAVWTGTQMLLWGGYLFKDSEYGITEGAIDTTLGFTPASSTWTNLAIPSGTGEPSEREYATAVWTGQEAIVWGGQSGSLNLRTGGIYRRQTGWTNTPVAGAPSGRTGHTAVWTGDEMLIWGGAPGFPVNSGGRFHVASNVWRSVDIDTAPRRRADHTAVWTGTEMIVWGGYDVTNYFATPEFLSDGARYRPATDSWTNMFDVPFIVLGRAEHTAVWTGTEMIIWGGVKRTGPVLSPTYTYYKTARVIIPAATPGHW